LKQVRKKRKEKKREKSVSWRNMVISRATSPPVNPTSLGGSSTSNYNSLPHNLQSYQQQYQQQQQQQQLQTSQHGAAAASQKFSENFWGEKVNGFDVLCQNLKHSLTSVKELEAFLRESVNSEDTYGKVLNKLVSQTNKYSSSNGTFSPFWSPLRELNERYAQAHAQLVHQLHELIKEIQRYNDELSKKIKKIRENETQTQNVVQSFQESIQLLNKTREQYQNLSLELEKQKRQLDSQQLAQLQQMQQQQLSTTNLVNAGLQAATSAASTNPAFHNSNPNNLSALGPGAINASSSSSAAAGATAATSTGSSGVTSVTAAMGLANTGSGGGGGGGGGGGSVAANAADRLSSLANSIAVSKVSQVLKLDKKLKLAFEDYKTSVDKYNSIRVDYERKLADSCNHFQFAEETHLKQMRSYVEAYSKLMGNINANKQQIFAEFQHKLYEQYTVDYLLQLFIENKRTGTERPEAAQLLGGGGSGGSDSSNLNSALFNTTVNYSQHINSPTPSAANNSAPAGNILGEDFTLFINGASPSSSSSLSNPTNSGVSTAQSQQPPVPSFNHNELNDVMLPPPPPLPPTATTISNSNSRSTPVYFSSASLINPPTTGAAAAAAATTTNSVAYTQFSNQAWVN
jgi:hypothetical protein